MDVGVRAGDEIWTADDEKLGVAECLHLRPAEEVNPEEQLYAAYLEIRNYELGDDYYVPTDFLGEREGDGNRVLLPVTMKDVMQNTWSRAPRFALEQWGRRVSLPSGAEADQELEEAPA